MSRVQAIVIGAGRAGLSVGYHLAPYGVSFVILEARARVGDVWRDRWEADCLERYAARFELRVYRAIAVDRVWREYDRYVVTPNRVRFEAEHVVIAMASYQQPSCRGPGRGPGYRGERSSSLVFSVGFSRKGRSSARNPGI
jgi:putative flavoprotein involved in K+ transport